MLAAPLCTLISTLLSLHTPPTPWAAAPTQYMIVTLTDMLKALTQCSNAHLKFVISVLKVVTKTWTRCRGELHAEESTAWRPAAGDLESSKDL